MSGDLRYATAALEKAIGAALPATRGSHVSVGRPGWSWRDLLGNRVNICLVRASDDRYQSNELLPSRPNARAMSLTYLVTFYGRTVEDHLEAILEALVRRPDLGDNGSGTGMTALVRQSSLNELADIWGLFRRRYAPSIIIEVTGIIIGTD